MRLADPSTDKEFKVVGHGNAKAIMEDGKPLNPMEVAQRIQSSPEYIGGEQKVILYSCNTGQDPNGFARQLADLLGVVVEAPNKNIQPAPDGRFVVGDITVRFGHKK